MKKIVGSLSIVFLFFMFSCGSGPETADEQEVQKEVEFFEQEIEEVKMDTEKKPTDEDQPLIERSAGKDKEKVGEEKMIERRQADPKKEEPELQLNKKD